MGLEKVEPGDILLKSILGSNKYKCKGLETEILFLEMVNMFQNNKYIQSCRIEIRPWNGNSKPSTYSCLLLI